MEQERLVSHRIIEIRKHSSLTDKFGRHREMVDVLIKDVWRRSSAYEQEQRETCKQSEKELSVCSFECLFKGVDKKTVKPR